MKTQRITFFLSRGEVVSPYVRVAHAGFKHGKIIVDGPDTIQFVFRLSPDDTPTLIMDKADENALWTRGWLYWWWPPHRSTMKSMMALAAMSNGGARIAETAVAKKSARIAAWWNKQVAKPLGEIQQKLLDSYWR